MPKLINTQDHIAQRCKQIADLVQQLAVNNLTALQKAEIVHNIKVHKAVIKQLQK